MTSRCFNCGGVASQKCSRCKVAVYCNRDCQAKHWAKHKLTCNIPIANPNDSNITLEQGLTLEETKLKIHKAAFDNILEKYNLKSDANASAIADYLTDVSSGVRISRQEFAQKFGMTEDEAGLVLSWIEIGVKFKEENLKTPDAI